MWLCRLMGVGLRAKGFAVQAGFGLWGLGVRASGLWVCESLGFGV